MKFETSKHIYTAFDGRIILRADIDRPSKSDGRRFEYLTSLSNASIDFIEHTLYLSLHEEYKAKQSNEYRLIPYNYGLKMSETYRNDVFLSVLMIASLRKRTDILYRKFLSVIFKDDYIVPQKLISNSQKDNHCLILTEDGIPARVVPSNGALLIKIVDKYNFPI